MTPHKLGIAQMQFHTFQCLMREKRPVLLQHTLSFQAKALSLSLSTSTFLSSIDVGHMGKVRFWLARGFNSISNFGS